MGIAFFSFESLLAPLQRLVDWLTQAQRKQDAVPRSRPAAAGPAATQARPLRVVRVLETPTGAGRMVISGRMADVCAELDRLAALEATAG